MKRIAVLAPAALVALVALGCPSKDDKPKPTPATATATATATPSGTAAARPSRYKTRRVEDGKSIEVRVTAATPKVAPSWELPAEFKEHCGVGTIPDESMAVEGGGVTGAVVWLDDITEGEAVPERQQVVHDQRACMFTPHVLAMAATGTLVFLNSDPANHMVRLELAGSPHVDEITKTIAPKLKLELPVSADWAGRVATVTCPIHLWMWSYVHFFDHPYFAVTKAGVAKLERVPPGTYHLSVWHEGVHPKLEKTASLPPADVLRVEVTVGKDDVKRAFLLGDDGKLKN